MSQCVKYITYTKWLIYPYPSGSFHWHWMDRMVINVELAPDSPASYSRIWGWRIWCQLHIGFPDSKVHGANMGPNWGRHDLRGPHVGPMKFAIWVITLVHVKFIGSIWLQLVISNYNKTQQIVIHLHNSWKEFMCCSGKVAVFDISRGFTSGLNIIFFIQLICLEAKMVDLPDDSHWNWELLWCQLLRRWRI